MEEIWVHLQYAGTKQRPYSKSFKSNKINVKDIINAIDGAYAEFDKKKKNETTDKQIEKLKKEVATWKGYEITGNGLGKNYKEAQLPDNWHIDIEVTGKIKFS